MLWCLYHFTLKATFIKKFEFWAIRKQTKETKLIHACAWLLMITFINDIWLLVLQWSVKSSKKGIPFFIKKNELYLIKHALINIDFSLQVKTDGLTFIWSWIRAEKPKDKKSNRVYKPSLNTFFLFGAGRIRIAFPLSGSDSNSHPVILSFEFCINLTWNWLITALL